MAHIIVATHGRLANGFMDSMKMICGEQQNVISFCAYTDGDNNDDHLSEKILAMMDSVPEDEEIVVLVDLLGGSVCHEFIRLMDRRPFYLISGVNLGLLLEFVFAQGKLDKDRVENIIEKARSSIIFVNQLIEEGNDEVDTF